MWFKLAEMLGYTVGQLKAMMSSREFTSWLAEFKLRAEDMETQARHGRVQESLKAKKL